MPGTIPSMDRIAGLAVFLFMDLDNTSCEQGWRIRKVESREIFFFCDVFISSVKKFSATMFFKHIVCFDCGFQCHINLINADIFLAL